MTINWVRNFVERQNKQKYKICQYSTTICFKKMMNVMIFEVLRVVDGHEEIYYIKILKTRS